MEKNKAKKKNKAKSVYSIEEDFFSKENPIPPGEYYPLHYHEHLEMELVLKGKATQVFDGKHFTLNPKDIFLMLPEDCHDCRSSNEGVVFRKLEIKLTSLPNWAKEKLKTLKNPIVFHLSDSEFKTFDDLMILLEKEVYDKHAYFYETGGMLCELIFTYFFRLIDGGNDLSRQTFLTKVMYYLEHNKKFVQKVSLSEIASYTGYSKFYTSSMFRKLKGTTIQAYVIALRIEYAKTLLRETDYPIAQIVADCGFSSASNFYPQFIKLVGCPPFEYRKKEAEKRAKEQKGGVDREILQSVSDEEEKK